MKCYIPQATQLNSCFNIPILSKAHNRSQVHATLDISFMARSLTAFDPPQMCNWMQQPAGDHLC
jgi:hypothetical protein